MICFFFIKDCICICIVIFILPQQLYFFPLFALRYLASHRESNWCNQTGSSNLALDSKLYSLCSRQVFNLTSDVLEQVDSPNQTESNLSVMRTPIHTIPLAMCGIPSLQPLTEIYSLCRFERQISGQGLGDDGVVVSHQTQEHHVADELISHHRCSSIRIGLVSYSFTNNKIKSILHSLPSADSISLQHPVHNGSRWIVQGRVDLITLASHHRSHLVIGHQIANVNQYAHLLTINLSFRGDN